MPELLNQRRRDLEAQLASLPTELDRWEKLTLERDFEKHHSQVIAISRQMCALNDRVRNLWNGQNDIAAIQKAQKNCAAVQRAWNYYREKLLMRFDPKVGAHLRAADAYVWCCYEPVLVDRRVSNPGQPFREPPLVAFDTEISPSAQSRRDSAEAASHGTNSLDDPDLAPMPIAVLGIPWSTAEVLPNLSALAHETGHVIESDFKLKDTLEEALLQATKNSALNEGWTYYWRKEVFADLFACFVAGPSHAWMLTESIPESPEAVETKVRPPQSSSGWGKYPPGTLRVLLNVFALSHLGLKDEAEKIEKYWKDDYPRHALAKFEDDVKAVVPAVYEAAKLPDKLQWKHRLVEYETVKPLALWQETDLDKNELYDPRTLVALASHIHRVRPNGVDVDAVWGRLQKHIVESRPPGVLAGQQERTAPGAATHMRTDDIAKILFADDSDADQ